MEWRERRIAFAVAVLLAVGLAALAVLIPRSGGKPAVFRAEGNPLPGEIADLENVRLGAARPRSVSSRVSRLEIHYRAHDGSVRSAVVVVPRGYDGRRDGPIPLVISPHGRGLSGRANARLWGTLPAIGGFALVSPDGQGRRLSALSWGFRGQIDDLARMPTLVERALPRLRIDRARVYAFGGSMGGQEALLLAARHPRLLAGVAAFDSVTDLARQYRNLARPRCETPCKGASASEPAVSRRQRASLRELMQIEVGGPPATRPAAYADRSPLRLAPMLAASCIAVQVWWSRFDRIVAEPERQSSALLEELTLRQARGGVEAFVGAWIHSAEFRASSRLPFALARFGLLPAQFDRRPSGLAYPTSLSPARECGSHWAVHKRAA